MDVVRPGMTWRPEDNIHSMGREELMSFFQVKWACLTWARSPSSRSEPHNPDAAKTNMTYFQDHDGGGRYGRDGIDARRTFPLERL